MGIERASGAGVELELGGVEGLKDAKRHGIAMVIPCHFMTALSSKTERV